MTRARLSFLRSLIRWNSLLYNSWLYSWLDRWWIILSNSWIIIRLPFVFTSKSYFINILSNLVFLNIILARSRQILFWFFVLRALYKFYRGRWWFDILNRLLDFIWSDSGIRISFPLIFSSNSHFSIRTMSEWFDMIILSRIWSIIFIYFIWSRSLHKRFVCF